MAGDSEASNIRVAVRCRPFSAREQSEGEAKNALACTNNAVQVLESTRMPKSFTYDHVFGCSDSQEAIFEAIGLHLLDNAMNAYNGCIFAYGQTGSGKSHSIMGDVHNEAEQGILPRACTRLFSRIQEARQEESGFEATVLASYLEIYNEKIYDLLTGGDAGELQARNHPDLGPIVPHLTECPVESFEEAHELLDFGAKRRAVGATQMNATSSRSHAVFTLQVRMVTSRPGGHIESQAKVHFVDLAGSERQKKTGAAGERLKEGIGINLSLTTLGRVISELTKPGTRSVPAFREPKLTLLLKDALMGNSRTELLACISPSLFNLEETVSTLEFAARCKLVKTSAVKNEQSKTDVIQRLTDEKAVIEDQLRQERLQREELSRQLQALEEKQKAAERALEEKKDIEEQLRLEKQHEMEHQLSHCAEKEQLRQEKEKAMKVEASLTKRLAELAQQEHQQREEARKELELRCRLEDERKQQRDREAELLAQLDALKGIQESIALDEAQLAARREEQHRQREAELAKLGMHFVGMDLDDVPKAPKLVNLHPDPALKGCLVYSLPMGETRIGADPQRCRVALSGLNVAEEVCAVENADNVALSVRSLGEGLVRVNGCVVPEAGQSLQDGDRLAIGRAYIFRLQVPEAGASKDEATPDDFEHALEEISACAQINPEWENGVQKAMLLVKSDFGDEAANKLLRQAKRASEACEMANGVLQMMPLKLTDGVRRFELSILFNAQGLPEVCVVARRSGEGNCQPVAGIWEVEHFWQDRLPPLFDFLTTFQQHLGADADDAHGDMEETPDMHWESRVWSDISISDFRALLAEREELLRNLKSVQEALDTAQATRPPRGRVSSVLSGWRRQSSWGRSFSPAALLRASTSRLKAEGSPSPKLPQLEDDFQPPPRDHNEIFSSGEWSGGSQKGQRCSKQAKLGTNAGELQAISCIYLELPLQNG